MLKAGLARCCRCRARAKPIRDHGIGPHGTSDILEALLAQIGELDRDLASDLIVGGRRDADATGFGDALKPRCDVDAVSKDVVTLDEYVAEVDADPKSNTPVFHLAIDSLVDTGLKLHSSTNRRHRTETPPRTRRPCSSRCDHHVPQRGRDSCPRGAPTAGVGRLFVDVHEPRIASHVGGQYRRQSAVDPAWPLLHHGARNPLRAMVVL